MPATKLLFWSVLFSINTKQVFERENINIHIRRRMRRRQRFQNLKYNNILEVKNLT